MRSAVFARYASGLRRCLSPSPDAVAVQTHLALRLVFRQHSRRRRHSTNRTCCRQAREREVSALRVQASTTASCTSSIFERRTDVGLIAGLKRTYRPVRRCQTGDVWIAQADGHEVVEYPRASLKQIRVVQTSARPFGCAVAPNGDLAVANFDEAARPVTSRFFKKRVEHAGDHLHLRQLRLLSVLTRLRRQGQLVRRGTGEPR